MELTEKQMKIVDGGKFYYVVMRLLRPLIRYIKPLI